MKSTLLFFFILTTTNAFAQDWNTIQTFTPGQTIQDVYFADTNTAYAVSSLYNRTALNVKKTSDGGQTWEEQFTGHTQTSFYNIASPNDGADVFIVGSEGALIHTNDGGENWDSIDLGIADPIWDVFFLNETIGFVSSNEGNIWKTVDGGATWNNINAVMEGVGSVSNICFISENRGFVGGFNYFKETFDGGATWSDVPGHEPQPVATMFQIQEIKFLDENVGYFSGDSGLLFKTEDGGQTWIDKHVEIPSFVTESLFSFDFLDEYPEVGFACGYQGLLIRTLDGGDNWELMTSDIPNTNTPEGDIFHALDFYGNNGFLGSHFGELLSYEYVPVDDTSIEEGAFENHEFFIYPNPSSTTVFINEKLNGLSYEIIDELGRSILSGKMKGSIDVSSLNNGMYYFSIMNGSFGTIKLVKE